MDKKSSVSNNGAVVKPKKRHHLPHFMRNVGWYFAILIVILLIVIMAVPSVSIFSKRGRGEGYVFGKFANKNIEFADSSYMLYAYNGIMQQYSRFLDNQQIVNMQMSIMQQAFQSAAVATATEYYGQKEGMVVSDEQIDDYIKNNYTDDSGKFNRDSWSRISQGEKNRIRRFAKNDIIQNAIIDDIKSAPIPTGEIETLKAYKEEENRKNNANNTSTESSESTIDDTNESVEATETSSEVTDTSENEEVKSETEDGDNAESQAEPADPSLVSETVVIKDIRDTATDRYSQSVLASPKLKDNFVDTYNKEILPQLTRNNEENRTSEESATEENAESTESNEEDSTVEEAPDNAETTEASENVAASPSTPEAEVTTLDNSINN